MADRRFLTDETGRRLGVVLDMATYEALTRDEAADPELLSGLSEAELRALAESKLAPEAQNRLRNLLAKQRDTALGDAESEELEHLTEQIDQLDLLKARARYTLERTT